jgi:hypothetical protein
MSTGGITAPSLSIPAMPAVTSGAENYENRMSSTLALTQVVNGNLSGGGKRLRTRYRNHVTKVMKGCSNKKTRRHNKKKRHGKRIFRGGNSITPAVTGGGQIELTMPVGSSPTQVGALQDLTKGLLDAQTTAGNIPPSIPAVTTSIFSGGGVSTRRRRNTKYRRLRYKKSIGRKSRSYRRSGRR